jgi:hypothetical protein
MLLKSLPRWHTGELPNDRTQPDKIQKMDKNGRGWEIGKSSQEEVGIHQARDE